MEQYEGVLPVNIKKVYDMYLEQENQSLKLELMFSTYAQVFRYIGCILLSEYMDEKEADFKVNSEINKLLRPALGNWVGFLRVYLGYKNGKSIFIKELFDTFNRLKTGKFEVYKEDFRSGMTKTENPVNAILELRNMIAHGSTPPNGREAVQLLLLYNPCLTYLLQAFQPVFENYQLGKFIDYDQCGLNDEGCFTMIDSTTEYSNRNVELEYDHPEFEKNDLCLISNDNRILRLSGFFVEIFSPSNEENETYFIYDGLLNRSVVYIGTEYKKHLESYLEAIRSKFLSKDIELRWKKEGFSLEEFKYYLNELSDITVQQHIKTGKYNPQVYLERSCDYIMEDFIQSDKTTLVVKAEAGVGKTSFLCHSINKITKNNGMVYFINGASLVNYNSDDLIFAKLKKECLEEKSFRSIRDFFQLLKDHNEKGYIFTLIIDAVNEAYNVINVLEEIDNITNMGEEYPWLKVIISIRTVSYEICVNRVEDEYGKRFPLFTDLSHYYIQQENSKQNRELELQEWNISEEIKAFDRYKEYYGLGQEIAYLKTNREIHKLIKNPLNMNFYFSVMKQNQTYNIMSEKDLFGAYHRNMEGNNEFSKSLIRLLNILIASMYEARCNHLDLDQIMKENEGLIKDNHITDRMVILSPYERLRDMGIVYEKETNHIYEVGFVYQKYLEFLLYRHISGMNYDKNQQIQLFVKSAEWQELQEAHMSFIDLISDWDNKYDALIKIVKASEDMKIGLERFKLTLMNMMSMIMYEDKVNGFKVADKLVLIMKNSNIFDWGVNLVERFYQEEEIECSIVFSDLMFQSENELNNDDLLRLTYVQGLVNQNKCNMEEAIYCFEKCLTLCEEEAKGRYLLQIAKSCRKNGNINKAKELIASYMNDSRTNKESIYYAEALAQRGLCSYAEKNPEKALEDYNKAHEIALICKDDFFRLYNLLGISTALAKTNEVKKAKEILMEIYTDTNRLGYQNLFIDSMNGLAALCVITKEYDEAILWAKEGLVLWEYSEFYLGQMVMYGHIINALVGKNAPLSEIQVYIDKGNRIRSKVKEELILLQFDTSVSKVQNAVI